MKNLYKEIYSVIKQGVAINRIILDPQGAVEDFVILEANESYAEMLGKGIRDITAKKATEVIPDLNPKWLKVIGDITNGGNIRRFEKYNLELERYFEIDILSTGGGEFIMLTTDVTEKTQKERQMASLIEELTASEEELRSNYIELEKTKNNLEKEHNRKNQFLDDFNQEIKIPLNGVLAFARLLSQTKMNQEQQEYLNMINDSCIHMMELVDKCTEKAGDMSKYESGTMEQAYKRFKVKDTLLRIIKEFSFICDYRNLKFNYDLSTHIPMTVIGDELAINQILAEILNNLVKFTNEGEISLRADKIFQVDRKITLKFELRDTGLKIKKDNNELYEKIIHPSVHELIKLMNGQIWIEENEAGTEGIISFTAEFYLDTAILPDVSEIKYTADCSEENGIKKILVVEENHINMKIVTELLKKCGYGIVGATNGKEAVNLFIKNKVDMILMDVHMAGQDGYETTTIIRNLESAFGTHVPIIGTMSWAGTGSREHCINAGMEDYLLKPFEFNKLDRLIKNYL